MEFAKKIMTEKAEKLNGKAAMLGMFALIGAYYFTGQILPGIFCKKFFVFYLELDKSLFYFSLFGFFFVESKSHFSTHSSREFSDELFISQLRRQS